MRPRWPWCCGGAADTLNDEFTVSHRRPVGEHGAANTTSSMLPRKTGEAVLHMAIVVSLLPPAG